MPESNVWRGLLIGSVCRAVVVATPVSAQAAPAGADEVAPSNGEIVVTSVRRNLAETVSNNLDIVRAYEDSGRRFAVGARVCF